MTLDQILEWAQDHEHLFKTLAAISTIVFGALSCTLGVVGTRIYYFYQWRQRVKEYLRMENPGIVVNEAHVLKRENDGTISLQVISWGGKITLTDLLHDPILEAKVEKIAAEKKGFLVMTPQDQLLVMDGLQESITGNDASANMDLIRGRRVNTDQVIMCPVTWPGLRSATVIRNIIVSNDWMQELLDPGVVQQIRATRSRYQYRGKWLHEIALRWQIEKDKLEEEACMRLVEIESQS